MKSGVVTPAVAKFIRVLAGSLLLLFHCGALVTNSDVRAATIKINGAETHQTIDGFGVNVNHRSWNNDELKPALDALIDQAGMTLFRVVYENTDWEGTNDNPDSNSINWPYYNPIYNSAEFQKFWDLMRYLNQKGITNGVMPNFQGFGPDWMGFQNLDGGFEGEWAEMIASALVFARYSNHVAFNLVAPHNEPDLPGSGIGISNAVQYVASLRELSQRLDANGMGDVRFVGPDRIFDNTEWLPAILGDATVMSKLAHIGAHSYSNYGGGTDSIDDIIKLSAYPDRNYWVTEFGVWCEACQNTFDGTNTWGYARAMAEYIWYYLDNSAAAALVWDACDGIYLNNYNNNPHPSSWGLLALDDPNADHKTYTPRKAFYTVAQVSKFVRPGARKIGLTGSTSPLLLSALTNAASGQLVLTGVNPGSAVTLRGTITNLAPAAGLELYYTDATHDLFRGGSVAITNAAFTAVIPADCVFSLASPLGPVLSARPLGANIILSWPTNWGGFVLEASPNLMPGAAWTNVASAVFVHGDTFTVTNAFSEDSLFYRLRR